MSPAPNLPPKKEAERLRKISEASKRRHRLDKLDIHIHKDSVDEELKEAMIEYGYVNLSKAIVRHGLTNEGIGYLEGEDGQFWLSIIKEAIREDRE